MEETKMEMRRITDWCIEKEELNFAVDQVKKHGDNAEIRERMGFELMLFAVYRDGIPRGLKFERCDHTIV